MAQRQKGPRAYTPVALSVMIDAMTHIFIHWCVGAFALLVVSQLIPGVTVTGLVPALVAAAALGFLNILVRPILFVLTLPINILTLGLFSFILNAGLFWLAASWIDGFSVTGFMTALFGSVATTIVTTIARWFVG